MMQEEDSEDQKTERKREGTEVRGNTKGKKEKDRKEEKGG